MKCDNIFCINHDTFYETHCEHPVQDDDIELCPARLRYKQHCKECEE